MMREHSNVIQVVILTILFVHTIPQTATQVRPVPVHVLPKPILVQPIMALKLIVVTLPIQVEEPVIKFLLLTRLAPRVTVLPIMLVQTALVLSSSLAETILATTTKPVQLALMIVVLAKYPPQTATQVRPVPVHVLPKP